MDTISPDVFAYFAKIIYDETGIVYNDGNKDALEKRIKDLAAQFDFPSVTAFYNDCQKLLHQDTKAAIIDKATNNETSFFRDLPVYENLSKHVLAPLVDSMPDGRKIRLWSSACSMGQEPYTLAMILTELTKAKPRCDFEIVASDISSHALDFAKKGRYRQMEIQRGLKAEQLKSYFKEEKTGAHCHWQLSSEIQRKVSFTRHNLLEPLAGHHGKFDVVLCRNVLIYFDLDTRKKILTHLMAAMLPNAHMLLGAAESIPGIQDHFDTPKELVSRIYKLKPTASQSAA